MRILFIGEIVGSAGIYCVKALLPELKRELDIDLTIAAAEGATGGFGIGKGHAVYLHKLGVDVITAGDFAYFKRDAVSFFGQSRYLLRPANYPFGNPGRGWLVARPNPMQPRPGTAAPRAERQPAAAAAQSATASRQPAPATGQPAPTTGQPAPATRQPAPATRQPAPVPPQPAASAPASGSAVLAAVAASAMAGTSAGAAAGMPVDAPAGKPGDATGDTAAQSSTGSKPAGAAGGAEDAASDAAAVPSGAAGAGNATAPPPPAVRANPSPARSGGGSGKTGRRRRSAPGPSPAAVGKPPAPGAGIISLLGQAGFSRVHLRSPFELVGGLIERVKQQTPIVLVDFHATTTSEKVAMSLFLDGKVTALIGTHVRTLSADARLLPGGTAAITHSGRTGSLNSVGGLDPEVETRKFLTQVHEQSRDAWGLLELQGVVLEVGEDGAALGISTLRRQTTAPEAARKAAEASRNRGPGRGRRPGGRR